ncbi:MAG: type V CRISPR-associated endonuclease Cas1 [Clostridioides sp.]|jgi:CRISPR-associated protein Cas1|nr:type V CRISPR-associated endonuclease Cas1 [Clostridioides sp.]
MLTESNFKARKVVVVFANQGQKIKFKNDNIVVTDKEGKILLQFTCYRIFMIYIIGGFTITTGIVERAKKFGISICFMTAGFKYYESLNYFTRGNTLLVSKQYNCPNSEEIAKLIIKNKIRNQRKTLLSTRKKEVKEGVSMLDEALLRLNEDNLTIAKIMGIEGTAAKVYFNRIFNVVDWNGRQPRIKRDIINLLLDIGYTVLFNYIDAIASIYGFDVYKGNLHQEFYNRKSLICDFVEPFRVIVDKKIRNMYALNQIKEEDFKCIHGKWNLNYKSSTNYTVEFITETNKYSVSIFRFVQSYYRWFTKDSTNTENFPSAEVYKNDPN